MELHNYALLKKIYVNLINEKTMINNTLQFKKDCDNLATGSSVYFVHQRVLIRLFYFFCNAHFICHTFIFNCKMSHSVHLRSQLFTGIVQRGFFCSFFLLIDR